MEELRAPKPGDLAHAAVSYGGGRFRVRKQIAGAGQGYVLLVDDLWCDGYAVLKGMWWKSGQLRDESWEIALERIKAGQQDGLKAVYQAMQLSQQVPVVLDLLVEPSPTLLAERIQPVADEFFVVTEFIGLNGEPVHTLDEEIRNRRERNERFSESEMIELAEQLCAAVGALHTRRRTARNKEEYWIHGDIKPENVLVLGPPAQYILIDYDAAVLDGKPIGTSTPAFSPPIPLGHERSLEADAAHERYDIYMLGATLVEAMMLERLDETVKRKLYSPVEEIREFVSARNTLTEHIKSPILATIIASCLARPEVRTRNVQSILTDLARARDTAALVEALR